MSRFEYSGDKLREVRFPLGGIGAGCVSIDGGARLVDWEWRNRPNKESYNGFSHIAVKAEQQGRVLDARVLNGPLPAPYMGKGLHPFGGYTYGPARETLCGVPHFTGVTLNGRFPIAQYSFEGAFPAKAQLNAWSPFEPMNDFDASLPLACFEVELTNPLPEAVDYYVAFTLCNPHRGRPINADASSDGRARLLCRSDAYDNRAAGYGEACLATDVADAFVQQNWYRGMWFDGLNMFWQEFRKPGQLSPRALDGFPTTGPAVDEIQDHGVVCAKVTAQPGETARVRFALSWFFPNYEKYWGETRDAAVHPVWRNWYATQFTGAQAVADYGLTHWTRMYRAATRFADATFGSSLPEEVIDAAGSTLAVLKSPTCVRLTDGSFYAWEGSHARDGSCEGSCQHVWNYQYALPLLFPALERSMRELDYYYNMKGDGGMPFRLQLPLGTPASNFRPCADGQLGGVIKSYREWKLSGDDGWLKRLWPYIKRSLEYVWSDENPDRWDPEKTGMLTGRQHHTLDMELFGPNSWLTGMYLAALEAAARMAEACGEADFAGECRAIGARGQRAMEDTLFNGEYYFHQVELGDRSILERFNKAGDAMGGGDAIHSYWNDEAKEIKYQIGEGSSIDQLLGQWHADLCGLGDFFDAGRVRTALGSMYKYNLVPDMTDFFNPCRIYCLQDEGGLLICAYPEGRKRPVISAPYAEETMHGFEYAAACHMIMRGMEEEGLACIRLLRDRYDGQRRNPWCEIECGGNYARSMAAWALVMAYQGLSVDMTRKAVTIAPIHAQGYDCVWAFSSAWGRVSMKDETIFETYGGAIDIAELTLPAPARTVMLNGASIAFQGEGNTIVFDAPITLATGSKLVIA